MPQRLEIQGHRGARGQRPENTLPSFEAALDDCVDSIETDLVLTHDRILILCHDLHLSPAICRPLDDGLAVPSDAGQPIRDLTLARIGQWVGDQNPDAKRFPEQTAALPSLSCQFADDRGIHPYTIPTLDQLFAFVDFYAGTEGVGAGKIARQRANAARVLFDLELKVIPFFETTSAVEAAEAALLDAIRRFDRAERCRVRSFDHRVVRRLVRAEPRLDGAVLVGANSPIRPSAVAEDAGAGVYCPDYRFLDRELVKEAQGAGRRVIPWTVNEPDEWARLIEWGVDGITTDYPGRLAAFYNARLEPD